MHQSLIVEAQHHETHVILRNYYVIVKSLFRIYSVRFKITGYTERQKLNGYNSTASNKQMLVNRLHLHFQEIPNVPQSCHMSHP